MSTAGEPIPPRKPAPMAEVLEHLSRLLRKEIDLARAEISRNLNRAGVAVAMIAVAAILVLSALNVLAVAAVAALVAAGLSASLAALIVGGGFALIAVILVLRGIHILKNLSLTPRETVGALRRDATILKEHIHDA